MFKYFELLLTVLPSMEFLNNTDILEELLPWNSSKDSYLELVVLRTKQFYSVNTELFLHFITHFKGNELAVIAIENRRNIELSVSALDFSDIVQKLLQRLVCTEIYFDQILSVLSFSISLYDTVRSTVPVNMPNFAHSPVYRSEASVSAFLCKSYLHLSDTVILVIWML